MPLLSCSLQVVVLLLLSQVLMAVSLCSDWGTVERAMVTSNDLDIHGGLYQQHPPLSMAAPLGLFGTSPSSWDAYDLPLLEHLINGSPSLDDYLLPDPSLDHNNLSSLLSSSAFPLDLCPASCEFDAYTPSGLLFGTTPFGGDVSCLQPLVLQSELAFATLLENPESMALQTPQAAAAVGFSGAGSYTVGRSMASGAVGGCPSAQSVAARQRRKRISEKTHELGQLVPGGSRMNTAEMLQAAFKYVKFLQAQVGMLDLMRSSQPAVWKEGEPDGSQQLLQALLASPAVQEKLASEERCVAPQWMVRALLEDPEIKSQPAICRDLRWLTAPMG